MIELIYYNQIRGLIMEMKSMLCLLLMIFILAAAVVPTVNAQAAPATSSVTEVELLPNGDRIETELITYEQPFGAKSTKSGQKTKSYKNSSGAVMWSVTVYGTFSYNGSTATCTSATRSTTCPGSGWSIVSSSASKSGNTATATATAKYSSNGVNYNRTLSVSLSCSPNGTLS